MRYIVHEAPKLQRKLSRNVLGDADESQSHEEACGRRQRILGLETSIEQQARYSTHRNTDGPAQPCVPNMYQLLS